MYGERPLSDAMRVTRAWATNQLARLGPAAYVKLTGQTGRGRPDEESADSITDYFERCFQEYFDVLGVARADIGSYLQGKCLLEYGPGDIPGVALLMLAHGARKVYCVDRFPMLRTTPRNQAVVDSLLRRLSVDKRDRVEAAVRASEDLQYLVRPSGLSGLAEEVELIYSRAVLEHVNDVPATFRDMAAALRPGGLAIHSVDLKSHGLHRRNPLDFLSWPEPLWQLMYSYKGVPNRLRVDRYRQAVQDSGLVLQHLTPTLRAAENDVAEIRPHLAGPFREVSDEDLQWLGFWMVCRK